MIPQHQCPVCGSKNILKVKSRTFGKADSKSSITSKQYSVFANEVLRKKDIRVDLFLCSICRVIFKGEIFEKWELDEIYSKLLSKIDRLRYSQDSAKALQVRAFMDEKYRRIFSKVTSLMPPYRLKNVIDVGGGRGESLKPFKDSQRYLLDPSVNLRGVEPISNLKVVRTFLEEYEPDVSFDCILCSHVLEHVSNPDEFIKKISSMMHDGSLLYLEVPYEFLSLHLEYELKSLYLIPQFSSRGDALAFRALSLLLPDNFLVLEHQYAFSPRSLFRLLKKHNLVISQMSTTVKPLVSDELFFGSAIAVIAKKAHGTIEREPAGQNLLCEFLDGVKLKLVLLSNCVVKELEIPRINLRRSRSAKDFERQ
jgi:transcription elongation factor Elf1